MVEKYSIRTDLALEQKERFEADNVEISGVVLEENYDEEREIKITTVKIETENGAKKRILVNETKNARNKAIKSKVKTCAKKVETAVANKDAAAAAEALKVAIVEINKAGSKGVYHKNTCARKISRLTKAVNGIA